MRSGKELKSKVEAPKEVERKEDDHYVMVKDVLKEEQENEKIEQNKAPNFIPSAYALKIPFPQKLKKQKDNKQFYKIFENF